jgi:hypothetical protein
LRIKLFPRPPIPTIPIRTVVEFSAPAAFSLVFIAVNASPAVATALDLRKCLRLISSMVIYLSNDSQLSVPIEDTRLTRQVQNIALLDKLIYSKVD